MKNLLVIILLILSLFLSGCASIKTLASLAGLVASGYGIYKALDK